MNHFFRSLVLTCVSFMTVIISWSQDLKLTPSNLNFPLPVYTTSLDSMNFTVYNNGCGYLTIQYLYSNENAFKLADSTGFTLAPSVSRSIKVYFYPRHNIQYSSEILLHTSSCDFTLPIRGAGRFIESYYDSTFNKFDESLKSTLNTILATNYQSYSYNAARDKMFMEFDNKKINGQGATQNTLECIYTGRLAVGYTSRADCQTNNSFNTEHTWPQSLFGSSPPMVSDLNHLFPTDDAANNYRGNNPFGMVSSPAWSVGGSKGISTLFEPRDAQKGRTARAMLYFAIRYNNPSYGLVSFFGPQEAILRTWCLQFLPDSIDRKRNNDIFGYQKNRNPFIDHPEFLERITSIANLSVAPSKRTIWYDAQTINKTYAVYDSINYSVVIYNSGNATIQCSNISSMQSNFVVSAPSDSIPKATSLSISLKKWIGNTNAINDTLVILNNSTNAPVIKIPISITPILYHITATKTNIQATADSAVLSIVTSGNVVWNNALTGKSLIVKTAGIYYATVTDSNGCHHTDTVTITKNSNGINSLHNETIHVYPNPANDHITIQNASNTPVSFQMINALGQVLTTIKVDAQEINEIDIRSMSNGIYLMKSDLGTELRLVISR